ncbi:MAG: lysophospholipase [Actinomycetota bacterium]
MTITSITDHGTTRDGLIQLRRRWSPTGDARAAVLLVHGLGEHSGRYEHVGGHLAAAGFEVISLDNRGFGGSGGKRAFVESFSQFQDDVEDQLAEVRTLGLPTVLLGHSLGALISTGYCVGGRPLPDALVVTGPPLGYELKGPDKALKVVGPLIRRFHPGYEVRDDWDATVFAEDISVGETFLLDPLRTDFMTISLALETIGEIERVQDAVAGLDLPTWVGHGGVDKIVPVWASEPFEQVESAVRTVYDGLGHEILNEPVGLDIVDDMIAWIEATLSIPA